MSSTTLAHPPAASNENFLRWAFGRDKYLDAHVCSFPDDPERVSSSQVWEGGPARHWLRHLEQDNNNYYTVSLFKGDARTKDNFVALHILGVDDIGTKIDPDWAREVLGEPSYRIETSVGSEQWGYRLAPPITDVDVADALTTKLKDVLTKTLNGPDPGQRNVTRYLRLPVSRNRKQSLGMGVMGYACHGAGGTACSVPSDDVILAVETRWKALSPVPLLAAPGGPTLSQGPATPLPQLSELLLPYTHVELDELDHVLGGLRSLGLVKRADQPARRLGSGLGYGWDIVCPWIDEHTNRADTGTAYGCGQGFVCHHGHCQDRVGRDLWDKVNALIEEDSGGVDSLNLRAFGPGTWDPNGWTPDKAKDPNPAPDPDDPDLNPDKDGDKDKDGFSGYGGSEHGIDQIEPRPWIAPGYLLRGAVTMLVGPPDQGKSAWLTTATVALLLGQQLGALKAVIGTCRVLTLFAEEDDNEQRRRFAAALAVYNATVADTGDRLYRLVPNSLATLITADRRTGMLGATRKWHELKRQIVAHRPDVVILDPLVEIHTANENDNAHLKAIIAALRSLAQRYHCAVLVTHHAGKTEVVPGSLNMARGASAIGGAVRVALTLVEMTETEADKLGVPVERRRWYVRLDQARSSQAPPAQGAEWFFKLSQSLASGDEAPAMIPWSPPRATPPTQILLDALIQSIGQGCAQADARPWSPQLRDNEVRSIRSLLREHGVDRVSEAGVLEALLASGEVEVRTFNDPVSRNPRQGYRLVNGGPIAAWK